MQITLLFAALVASVTAAAAVETAEHPALALGASAPDFSLPGVDGRSYSLRDFAEAKILVVVFTSVHCPTAQAYEGRLKQLVLDYRPRGVAFVAINPNNPDAVRLDEQGYTDLDDTFESMKLRAADRGFNYSFLDDGPTEGAARHYGPAATPDSIIRSSTMAPVSLSPDNTDQSPPRMSSSSTPRASCDFADASTTRSARIW